MGVAVASRNVCMGNGFVEKQRVPETDQLSQPDHTCDRAAEAANGPLGEREVDDQQTKLAEFSLGFSSATGGDSADELAGNCTDGSLESLSSSADVIVHCSDDHEHFPRQYVDTIVPLDVEKLFHTLFTDSTWFRAFFRLRKSTELQQAAWPEEPGPDGTKSRVITYTLALNYAIGPKTSPSVETQVGGKFYLAKISRYSCVGLVGRRLNAHCSCHLGYCAQVLLSCSEPGRLRIVDCRVENRGLPYSGSFYVLNRFCLTAAGVGRTRIRVCSKVVYTKSVFVVAKGMIESSAKNGLSEYFRLMRESTLLSS